MRDLLVLSVVGKKVLARGFPKESIRNSKLNAISILMRGELTRLRDTIDYNTVPFSRAKPVLTPIRGGANH